MGKSNEKLVSVTRIGLDLAKNVFQVHGVDTAGNVVVTRKLRRRLVFGVLSSTSPCLVAMEACASAHYWGREIAAFGHECGSFRQRIVKPYVRRNKTDAADAAAICEAALRPGQRFVPVRSLANQAALMRHRVREQLVGHRTALLNALRGTFERARRHRAAGAQHAYELKQLAESGVEGEGEILLRDEVRAALAPLAAQIDALDKEVAAIDIELEGVAKADDRARRLMTIPGVGPITATALAATVADIEEFAAFLGLTPRQHSSGGKERSGRISKMGDRYLRKLLVVGATSALYRAGSHKDALRRWVSSLLARKGGLKHAFKLTRVALANKLARIAFAIVRSGGVYDDRPVAA